MKRNENLISCTVFWKTKISILFLSVKECVSLWTCSRGDDIHSCGSKYTVYAIIISFLSVKLWKKRILVFGQFTLCFLCSRGLCFRLYVYACVYVMSRQTERSLAIDRLQRQQQQQPRGFLLSYSFSYSLSEFVLHCFGNMVQGMDVERRKNFNFSRDV